MKKTAVVLLFLFALLPLNAQRMIKYITFYPVPYGSHANLTVAQEFMINMGTDTESQTYKTEVKGDFSVAKDSDLEGFADIRGGGTLSTTGQVRSGNAEEISLTGKAYSIGEYTYLTNSGQTIPSLTSTTTSSFNGAKTLLGSTQLNKLAACTSAAQWRSLRLKGSQDCKMYLTCGGSGSTGCTTPIFSCKSGYCMESGVCTARGVTTQSCSGNYANAVSGTRYRTASCTASGWSYSAWTGACNCASGYSWNNLNGCTCQPDKVYCQGMLLSVNQKCYHGIWSQESCSGICCCPGDTPVLVTGVGGKKVPQCKDSSGRLSYSCVCQYSDSGLIIN